MLINKYIIKKYINIFNINKFQIKNIMNQQNNNPKKRKNDLEDNDIPDKGSPFKKVKKNIKTTKRYISLKHEKDITKDVKIIKNEYNTPYIIKYETGEYRVSTRDYFEKTELTFKCQYYRRTKDKPKTTKNFCDSAIKALKIDTLDEINWNFYLKSKHSDICLKLQKESNEDNHSSKEKENLITKLDNKKEEVLKNNKDKETGNNISENENEIKFDNSFEIDQYILEECKKNKKYLSSQSIFLKQFKNLYENNNIIIRDYHLHYLYKKYKDNCFPNTLDQIYDYCNYIENIGFFCRNCAKISLFNKEKKLFKHEHIIFFTDDNIRRIIASEHLLIDSTYTFPDKFYQTLIIMFYDPIYLKMFPGIFVAMNNKFYEGYLEVFRYIKYYISNEISNNYEKIKWETFTTDFEEALFKSFKNTFENIKELKHNGCFFHYLKNIRKYLVKNGFTKKENITNYKFIIKECYKLPFIENIEKDISSKIEEICKKDKIYKDFKKYFNNQWSGYFKNKTLCLKDIDKKFRTNNSLENFNRIFKNKFGFKGEVQLVTYVDTLIEITEEQIKYFTKQIRISHKGVSNNKIKNINKKTEKKQPDGSDDELYKEIEDISINEVDESNETERENLSSNDEESDDQVDINSLHNRYFLTNYQLSCSFDSFLSIFINAIYPSILNKDFSRNKKMINKIKKYKLYIKFIEELDKINMMGSSYFYDIYENYNKNNNCDLFELDEEKEKYEFLPIGINYRNFVKNEIFCIKYSIIHFCTGKCRYKNQLRETNIMSYPYIDIPLQAYIDNLSEDIDHIFKNYIYINLNTICNEDECYCENDKNVRFCVKKYEILEMPLILSVNTNINEFSDLKKYSQFISKIFKNEIILYETSYKLIGFITQPSVKHFVAYFENYNEKYIDSIKKMV